MSKKTGFNPDWKTMPEFCSWLREVTGDKYSARCIVCCRTFSLSNMGTRAVSSHMASEKHKKWLQARKSSSSLNQFFSSQTSAPSVSLPCSSELTAILHTQSSSMPTVSQDTPLPSLLSTENKSETKPPHTMQAFVVKENVTKAEILWALESVVTHKSMRSAARDVSIFPIMFPDSDIARKMQLGRDKMSYLILYGLGPYFKDELMKKVSACDQIVIGFDESLNKISQKNQMDINIRFWDSGKDEVVTRYLTSTFLGHTTAVDMLNSFVEAIPALLGKIFHISMDGPNVNFKFLRELKSYLKDHNIDHNVLESGSCGLHTLHCSFKTGMAANEWKIIGFLRALYNLFKDVPARRADYHRITGSETYPLKFCAIRWLENQKTAQRALDMLPHVCKYVREIKKENKAPTCSSFKIVEECVKDNQLAAKLSFFKTLASDLEPFLREFQTDAPMAPFLYAALSGVLRNLMERFIKSDVLLKSPTVSIDVTNSVNLVDVKKVDIGFATSSAIRNTKNVKDIDILSFRKDCRETLQKITAKILDRSPIKYKLIKYISCFDPSVAVQPEAAHNLLKGYLNTLIDNKWLCGSEADKAAREFKSVLTPEILKECKNFVRNKERLDHFWKCVCLGKPSIWNVIKMALLISHGNSNLERGFSINSECVSDNLREESLTARRIVYDAVNASGGVQNIVLSKGMIHAARNARSKYEEALEIQKMKNMEQNLEYARKRAAELEVKNLKLKKAKLLQETELQVGAINDQIKSLSSM